MTLLELYLSRCRIAWDANKSVYERNRALAEGHGIAEAAAIVGVYVRIEADLVMTDEGHDGPMCFGMPHRGDYIMATNQEDRERFASLFFGLACEFNSCRFHRGPIAKHWHPEPRRIGEWGIAAKNLPDFCDIKGPYFGSACEKLILNGWMPLPPVQGINEGYRWSKCFEQIDDPDLGRCTMLALERLMATKEEK